jgi:hypothetical protein
MNNQLSPKAWLLIGVTVAGAVWFLSTDTGRSWWDWWIAGGEAGIKTKVAETIERGELLQQDLENLRKRQQDFLARFFDSGLMFRAEPQFSVPPFSNSRYHDRFLACAKMGPAQLERLATHEQHLAEALGKLRSDPAALSGTAELIDSISRYVRAERHHVDRLHDTVSTVVIPIAEGRLPQAVPNQNKETLP